MLRRPWVLVLLLGTSTGALLAWRRRPGPDAPPAAPEAEVPSVQGRPRLVLPSGSPEGSVRHGSPASLGIEQEIELPVGRTVVGRGHEADVRLADLTVSPVHAEVLVRHDGKVLLRDLETENGVRVDGRPVVESPLVDGNRIELGDAVLLFQQDLDYAVGREGGELG